MRKACPAYTCRYVCSGLPALRRASGPSQSSLYESGYSLGRRNQQPQKTTRFGKEDGIVGALVLLNCDDVGHWFHLKRPPKLLTDLESS